MASMLQEQHQQQTSPPKPPLYPTSQPTSTVTTARSRRKAQTPRSSLKAESSVVGTVSSIRSDSNIVQNLLVQNTASTESRVPNIGSSSPVTVGSNPRWGNEAIATSHGTTAHTLTHVSEPLRLQTVGAGQYSLSLQSSSLGATESSPGHKQGRGGRTDTASPSPGYLPSMVMATSTVSIKLTLFILDSSISSKLFFLEVQ